MPPGKSPAGPLERFASDVVGLDSNQSDADIRAALFRKLRDDDFLPDLLAHEAILVLAGRSVDTRPLFSEAVAEADERRLHREVEQFAAGFFDTPVASRVDRYLLLGQACASHPRLIERLRLLRPGLKIDRSAIADPSRQVKRVIDDILDLFTLKPSDRAILGRERAEFFRSDPGLTDANRTRALRALAKRHPDVLALLPDHPAQLTNIRRKTSTDRFIVKILDTIAEPGELLRKRNLGIAVILLSLFFKLMEHSRQSTAFLPSFDPKHTTEPIDTYHRDELKEPIRRELARLGKYLDGSQLARVVAELPVEELRRFDSTASILDESRWTEPVRNRFVDRLKMALKTSGLGLSDEVIDDLAPRCFPKAMPRGKP